jgi:uncharacterized protein (DUF1697 family)
MSKELQYAAFLRGVMPTNAKMADLATSFAAAGFSNVKTVLGSGNLVFTATSASESAIERKAEKAMNAMLGRTFHTIVRSLDEVRALLAQDPFAAYRLPPASKCVVSFSRERLSAKLPVERDGARVLKVLGKEAFTTYLPSPRGPVFMELIKQTFGDTVTTRTWDTLKKVVAAAAPKPARSPR